MSFNIVLYKNNSENNMLNKDIEEVATLSGVIRGGTSLVNPIIEVSGEISTISSANYMEIAAFNRKYFITGFDSIRNGLIAISAHCDVLSTYAEAIKNNTAIIKRQENKYNLYLNDGVFRVYQNPKVWIKAFPAGFTTQEFVLAIAGN